MENPGGFSVPGSRSSVPNKSSAGLAPMVVLVPGSSVESAAVTSIGSPSGSVGALTGCFLPGLGDVG
jgi:hypothetical protein